jgi:hypothetical protein
MNIRYTIEIRANRKFAVVDHNNSDVVDVGVYADLDGAMEKLEDIALDELLQIAEVKRGASPATTDVRYVAF